MVNKRHERLNQHQEPFADLAEEVYFNDNDHDILIVTENDSKLPSQEVIFPAESSSDAEVVLEEERVENNIVLTQVNEGEENVAIDSIIEVDSEIVEVKSNVTHDTSEPETTVLVTSTRARKTVSQFFQDDSGEISLAQIDALRTEAKYGAPLELESYYINRNSQLQYDGQETSLYEFDDEEQNFAEPKKKHDASSDTTSRKSITYNAKFAPDAAFIAEPTKDVDEILGVGKTKESRKDTAHALVVSSEKTSTSRGTIDLGLLLLRVIIAALLMFKVAEFFLGFAHGYTVAQFSQYISSGNIGFKPEYATILSRGFAAVFSVASLAILLGICTPLATAAALVIQFLLIGIHCADYGRLGLMIDPQIDATSSQMVFITGILMILLILLGPGVFSVDASRKWAIRPHIGSFIAIVLAAAVAIVIWLCTNNLNPFTVWMK